MRDARSVEISRRPAPRHRRAPPIFAGALLLAIAGFPVNAADAPARTITIQERGMARADSDPKRMVYLGFVRRPSPEQVAQAYPDDVHGEVFANVICARVDHGALADCRVKDAAPDTPGVRAMALSLAGAYRAAPSAADGQPPGRAFVLLSLNLSDGLPQNDKSFRCLPVFCIEDLQQPPPPPKRAGPASPVKPSGF